VPLVVEMPFRRSYVGAFDALSMRYLAAVMFGAVIRIEKKVAVDL
jgi:hypothetical protein